MSIMTQLEFEMDFSQSEKDIARYILDHGNEVLNMSSRELAGVTYTSPATVVRLCRKIGLKGYNEFKIKYSAELQFDHYDANRLDVNFPFSSKDNSYEISLKLQQLNREVLSDTMQLINFEELDKIVDILYHCKDIDIYGSGNSLLTAMSFQHKMTRIGKNVSLRTLEGESIFMSYNSNAHHAAIIISYTGETNTLIRIAGVLKETNTPIIAVTSLGDNQLSHYADYILHIESKEKIFSKIAPFASQASMEYILNLIFSCIFQRDYDANIQNKISYDKRYDARHPSHSPVTEKEDE